MMDVQIVHRNFGYRKSTFGVKMNKGNTTCFSFLKISLHEMPLCSLKNIDCYCLANKIKKSNFDKYLGL